MAPNLIPEDRTDKNGITSRRWVKPTSDAASASPMPRPASRLSPEAQAKRIGAEIRAMLPEAVGPDETDFWSHDDYGRFRALIAEGEVEALLAIKKLGATKELRTCSPGRIGHVARQMREQGIENASELITLERMELRVKLIRAIDNRGRETGEPYLSEHDGAASVYLMAFTDPDDVDAIADVVKQRGLMPAEDMRGLIAQMKRVTAPLLDGAI